jgi:hypothetical protein
MFNNYQEVPLTLDFSEPLVTKEGLDFKDTESPKDAPGSDTNLNPGNKEGVEGDNSGTESESQDLSIELDFNEGADKEEENKEETQEEVSDELTNIVNVANLLADKHFDGELKTYEDFDAENPTPEDIISLISYNFELKEQSNFDSFVSTLSEQTRKIIEFDTNAQNPDELDQYLKTLIEEKNIQSLDIENEFDQERIVRNWYSNEGWTSAEIDEKIADLKNAAILKKEAARIKPRLVDKASEISAQKEDQQRQIKAYEAAQKQGFEQKVAKLLNSKKIGSLNLTETEVTKLAPVLMGDDVEVNLPGGKKVQMPYLEALIRFHKFSDKANIENLVLATWLLTDRENFDKKYQKMVQTQVTNEFVKDHKYGMAARSGGLKVTEPGKKQTAEANKQQPWKLKVR